VLTNGLASIAGPAGVAKENGVKKAAVLVTDVPAASGPVNQVGPVFYRNAGVELTVVTVPPDAADMTPQVQSAIQQGAEQIAMVGNPAFCTSALKAMKTLNFTGGIVLIPQCIDDTSAASIPGGYAGMKQITFTTNDPTDADFKAYGAVMDKYASGVNKGGVAPGGYVVVTGFARAFDGLTVEPTAAGITGALSAMTKPVKVPLGGGITFQCGTKPVAITPNICGGQALVADLDKDGNGSNYKLLDTAELTKL
jgi:branched-chain amino acid transport system substrate-binding protein